MFFWNHQPVSHLRVNHHYFWYQTWLIPRVPNMVIPWESWLSHYWVPNMVDLMGFSWVFMVINRDKWNLPSGNIPNMVMCSQVSGFAFVPCCFPTSRHVAQQVVYQPLGVSGSPGLGNVGLRHLGDAPLTVRYVPSGKLKKLWKINENYHF